MLEPGRYLYVVFCCQQAVEKTLKAIIAKRTGETPPRIHSLMRLAEKAAIALSEEQAQLFRELSIFPCVPWLLNSYDHGNHRAHGKRKIMQLPT